MKTGFAYIMEASQPLHGATPLLIDGKSVSFFIEPVLRYSRFRRRPQRQGDTDTAAVNSAVEEWELTFFACSAHCLRLRVVFSSTPWSGSRARHEGVLAKVGWWCRWSGSRPGDRDVTAMSQFLRESCSLEANAFTSLGNCDIACDRNGVALVGGPRAQFQRLVLCQALAAAYHRLMSVKMLELTNHLKHRCDEDLAKLQEQVLAFNAGDFFCEPVDISRHQLQVVWRHVFQHWQLEQTNKQLTRQLSDITGLLSAQWERSAQRAREERRMRERSAAKRQEAYRALKQAALSRRAHRTDITLSLIGLLSLLSLIQILPGDVGEFIAAWWALVGAS